MDVPVYNMQGTQVSNVSIDEAALGGDINPALVKQAYVMYHANTRQGSSKTLNRREVEGSTRKIYKQKGTGNARHGDRKVNIFKGGGHGHSKKRTREDFRQTMPKKMRRKANRNALLAKLMDNEVRIVDSISFDTPKTKAFHEFLAALKIDRSAVVALPLNTEASKNAMLSGRNVEDVTLIRCDQLNAFEMLNHRYLIIGRADLEAWLSGPSSQTGKDAKTDPMGRDANPAEPRAKKPYVAKVKVFAKSKQAAATTPATPATAVAPAPAAASAKVPAKAPAKAKANTKGGK